ncbi:MAG TPA: hypothetical protein VJQ61_15845 [Sinomonas sp.]|nr:hypothetical protein [Sinomonas sp.]
MESILVRIAPNGAPYSFRRGDRSWRVAAEPVHWFERVRWWNGALRLSRGASRVDVEVWQVQAAAGLRGGGLRTFELVRDQLGGGWSLRG